MIVIEVTIYDLPFMTLLGQILGVININNLFYYNRIYLIWEKMTLYIYYINTQLIIFKFQF